MKQTICVKCCMDLSDPKITFDSEGICNYCTSFSEHPEIYGKVKNGQECWSKLTEKIRKKASHFDCVIGVSGGIDSGYLCYVMYNCGLNPLLVTFDNELGTEISKHNIQQILSNTEFSHVPCKVNFNQYRALQLAYFKSGVLDLDFPADYIIEAFLHETARKHRINYIFSGGNYFFDAFMPTSWNYSNKNDYTNMMNIYRRFGDDTKLSSIPKCSTEQVLVDRYVHDITYVTPLNLVGYNRVEASKILEFRWNFQTYKRKHYENIFTRFYQNYILPVRWGIIKDKANLSNLIRSGGITRDKALSELDLPYEDFEEDKKFVLNKLGISEKQFEDFMKLPKCSHEMFGSDSTRLKRPLRFYSKIAFKVGIKK